MQNRSNRKQELKSIEIFLHIKMLPDVFI